MRRLEKLRLTALLLFGYVLAGALVLAGHDLNTYDTDFSQAEIVRLHIIADSDEPVAQQVKLRVRDEIVRRLEPLLRGVADRETALRLIASQRRALAAIASRTAAANGAAYKAEVMTGVFEFPLRVYGTHYLPAGRYEAVKVSLGRAAGRNWWCVLFPPLCFVDEALVKEGQLTDDESADICWRLKLLELLPSLEEW